MKHYLTEINDTKFFSIEMMLYITAQVKVS
jgi:hypothetical protein